MLDSSLKFRGREEGRRSGRGVCIQGSDIQGATAKMTFSVDHGFSAFENG